MQLTQAPFTMTMKDGTVIEVDEFDGGGVMVGDEENYEVAYIPFPVKYWEDMPDVPMSDVVLQRNIKSVMDKDGNTYTDFGNPYFPHHPYAV